MDEAQPHPFFHKALINMNFYSYYLKVFISYLYL